MNPRPEGIMRQARINQPRLNQGVRQLFDLCL